MIEVKTADLIGPALDWALAKAEDMRQHTPADLKYTYWYAGERCIGTHWSPSTNWSQGGPLIASHQVNLHSPQTSDDCWAAWVTIRGKDFCQGGWQPLVAACRAIVAAKLGDVVSVPTELI